MIKNPNWQEANSWLFTKRGRVESGTTGNKSWPEVRTGFEPRATACKPNTLTTELHLKWVSHLQILTSHDSRLHASFIHD